MGGPPYTGPATRQRSPYDNPDPFQPPTDSGFSKPADIRPGEEEAGPMYVSPEADQWIGQNVRDKGYVIDWGTREIIDPETGESHGTVPKNFPRMI